MRQYINQPPDYPDFIRRMYPASIARDMMAWAKKEYQDRLVFCAERGYWLELKKLNEEWSPIRILAESSGFRKLIAYLVKDGKVFNSLKWRERIMIRRAYELRDILFR